MADLLSVEGIGEVQSKKLKEMGIGNTDVLLERGKTPAGRKDIVEKTEASEKMVLKWINHVDLARIGGIGGQYAELLECAGVDTVPELAQRNGENLFKKLAEINGEKKLVRKLPSASQVYDWVDQAKRLPRVVTY